MWGALRGASLFKVKNMAIPTSFEQVTANSVDGAQMGKGVLEKNAFFGSTPVIQPTSGDQASVSQGSANTTATASYTAATQNSTFDETETQAIADALEVLRDEVAGYELEISLLVIDVAALITLGNQVRSELVTLGLIKGS